MNIFHLSCRFESVEASFSVIQDA